jgi:hypothetical protein
VADCCEYDDEPSGSGATELMFCVFTMFKFVALLLQNSGRP